MWDDCKVFNVRPLDVVRTRGIVDGTGKVYAVVSVNMTVERILIGVRDLNDGRYTELYYDGVYTSYINVWKAR